MEELRRYSWVEGAPAATITVVRSEIASTEALLERLGPAEARGRMPLEAAYELDGTLYGGNGGYRFGGSRFQEMGVFQVDRLRGAGGEWCVMVEPNGWRCSMPPALQCLAAGGQAASFFWNVNAVMQVLVVRGEAVVAQFDPLLDDEGCPPEGEGLPYEDHPAASAMLILERVSGVTVDDTWFRAEKPTFLVMAPADGTSNVGV